MLKGNIVALITPYTENNKVNYKKLIELIEYQISNGVDGIVLLGTTGESKLLTDNEQINIVKLGISVINKRVKLVVGISDINTINLVKKAKKLSKLDIDALLILTPCYLKTNNEGIIKHFDIISKVSKKPIIIYHVPSRTGQYLDVECIKKLSTYSNIIGIKEASGSIEYLKSIKQYLNDNFILLGGNDELMVKVMENGGSGIISVFSNSHPNIVSKIMKLCFENKYTLANKELNKYIDYIKLLFIEPNPIPIKEVMNYLGFEVGGYRLPLTNMNNNHKKVLIDELEEISK